MPLEFILDLPTDYLAGMVVITVFGFVLCRLSLRPVRAHKRRR